MSIIFREYKHEGYAKNVQIEIFAIGPEFTIGGPIS
jgi:hypothetical protein